MEAKISPLQELLTLIEDYHDFNPSSAERLTSLPTSVQFCQQVSRGLPCVYSTRGLPHRAGHWSKNDLIHSVHDKVEVAVTPDGRADSLCLIPVRDGEEETVFLQPGSEHMTLAALFDKLDTTTDKDPVYYLQSQNGNLSGTPLSRLFDDLPRNFSFARDALGEPDAVNIWIGDERSVTSAHRDPYENLYLVLRGSKEFTLWPPVDEVTLDVKMFRTGRHVYDAQTSSFSVVLDDTSPEGARPEIPWVTVDPSTPRDQLNAKHPLYQFARPQTVVVEAGHMLYLPSGWFHHVTQRCGKWNDETRAPCIAVNYWYDQDYEGEKHVMRRLIQRLAQHIDLDGKKGLE